MKIYVAHKSCFDYEKELYTPLRKLEHFDFYFPHEGKIENSKSAIESSDLILAEVSFPSLGVGIELGWAEMLGKRIVCIYKKGQKPSSALGLICDDMVEYEDGDDLKEKVFDFLQSFSQ